MNKKRYFGVTILTLILFMAVATRLFYVTVVAKDDIYKKAQRQISREVTIPAMRGSITDKNGALLASSTEAYRVDADLKTFRRILEKTGESAEVYALAIGEILGESQEVVLEKLTSEKDNIIIKRKLEKETIDELRIYLKEKNISFLLIGYDHIRYYPNHQYLSHVLGSVNVDGNGVMGLEYWYNETLKGIDGIKIAEIDKKNRELPYEDVVKTEAINGSNLVLAIDEKVQYFLQNLAKEALDKHQADSVTMMVSNPKTGQILGMVSLPDFDPNNPQENKTTEEFNKVTRNFAVNDSYEPGSTFKIMTFSAALEKGVVSEGDHFYCPGFIMVNGKRINCVKRDGHGDQTLGVAIKNSCNVATIMVAQKLGVDSFHEYLTKFQFGVKSGIDLPGETSGIIFKKEDMKLLDLSTSAIGQAQTVSPIQMLNTMNIISNFGTLNSLHLADEAVLTDHNLKTTVRDLRPLPVEGIITKETATRMLKLLYGVVGGNKYSNAFIEGMDVFGKTGTAQKIIFDEQGKQKYSEDEFISSFIGGAPYTDPKVTAMVIINNPKDAIYGNVVAAPWAKEILLEMDKYIPLH